MAAGADGRSMRYYCHAPRISDANVTMACPGLQRLLCMERVAKVECMLLPRACCPPNCHAMHPEQRSQARVAARHCAVPWCTELCCVVVLFSVGPAANMFVPCLHACIPPL